MSRVLRRPMFRGGKVDSYNTGIASGLGDNKRRGFNVGGSPIYPAGFSAVPEGGITGADIKKMAEKKVFMSGFGKDTANLNSTLKDLYMNYIQAPLEKGGNRAIDYMFGTEFEDKDAPFFGNQKDFKRIYERDVLPLATKMSQEMIPQISSEDEYEEAEMVTEPYFDEEGKLKFRPSNEVELRNKERIKSYIDNPVFDAREQAIMDQEGADQVKKIMDRKKTEEAEANRIKGGGQDASEADFEIPAGVTEMEGEQEVDGGAIGYKELADSYFEAMNAGADERMQQRLKDLDAKSAERIKKARIADLSDLGLNIFAKSQKEGATVGRMLGEAAEDLTKKPSRTEKEKDRADLRREKLEDIASARKEGRFDTATQMAFKELMQDKSFDFKDLQSEKSINAAMDRLKLQLKTTTDVAEKKILAQRLRDLEAIKNKVFAKGITEKDITYAMGLAKDSPEFVAWLNKNNYASTLEAQVRKSALSDDIGAKMSNAEINALGPLYYDDWGGIFIQGGDQKDGTYLDTKQNEIITIKNGQVVEELTESLTTGTK
tara:strand:+ start:480 stop:2117 length:1638 start_codon:yes stop_codon:yes gene_type:complete